MWFTSQIGYFDLPRHTNHTLTAILKYIQALHIFLDSLHGVYGDIHRALPVAVTQYFVIRPEICVLPQRLGIL